MTFPTDDVAIATYHVHQAVETQGGKFEMDSIDSTVCVKINGAWKCTMHTESPAVKATE